MPLFLLRSKQDNTMYIHPTGQHVFQNVYGLRKGKVGACCFTVDQCDKFIAISDIELEKEEIKFKTK